MNNPQPTTPIGHTPGPWMVYAKTKVYPLKAFTDPLENQVADTSHGMSQAQNEANCRLVAAAPELLEALKMMKERAADNQKLSLEDFAQLQTALKKAGAL